jgi:hypothetical protein
MSATALTGTIATSAYGCGDTTHMVALNGGDFLMLRVTGVDNANNLSAAFNVNVSWGK